jgi:hypothetical protein
MGGESHEFHVEERDQMVVSLSGLVCCVSYAKDGTPYRRTS